MPDPSIIKFSDVNTELGQTTTQIIRTSNNHVRNVAAAGLSGEYGFSDLRWGINFPGRYVEADNAFNLNRIQYRSTSAITISAINAAPGGRSANATISIESGGTIKYQAVSVGTNTFSRTWLTSGVNSDYTANLHLTSGSITTGSTTNTDLALSTTRTWTVRSVALGAGSEDSDSATGVLIIKSGGVELFRRSFFLETFAANETL